MLVLCVVRVRVYVFVYVVGMCVCMCALTPRFSYSLVDVVNQVEIIIPNLNDWEIMAVTWIAQPQYTAKLWFDPSRGDRKYTTRPYVLTSVATPQGVYLPGYFPEDG